jgi:hypothetical protein
VAHGEFVSVSDIVGLWLLLGCFWDGTLRSGAVASYAGDKISISIRSSSYADADKHHHYEFEFKLLIILWAGRQLFCF